jgi:hypothetical protein
LNRLASKRGEKKREEDQTLSKRRDIKHNLVRNQRQNTRNMIKFTYHDKLTTFTLL